MWVNAISSTDSKTLGVRFNIENVYSTRELALKKEELKVTIGMTAEVYGGIRYNMDTVTMKQLSKKYKRDTANYYSFNGLRGMNNDSLRGGAVWSELNSTMTEADNINSILKANNVKTKEFTGEEATEESFKALQQNNSPFIIHIATHGYFFPEPAKGKQSSENSFIMSDNPLMRSGLILAGANRVWKGGAPLKDTEDGILTAYEVSNMDLSNTKLVTLSACETGLGDIKGSEGVFGLQRAFKMAGVDFIIMSLWKVSNKETEDFMETFYRRWLKGEEIRQAFKGTQTEMQKKYKEPFKWGAFEMVH